RDVAIKVHRGRADLGRLEREAIAMARLAHPNVVAVHEIGETDGRVFVAMEYVVGTTLRGWMETPRRWRAVVDMIVACGRGLAAAHAAGLVHGDFKPENVLVGADGRPRVTDFGLARLTDEGARSPAGDRGGEAEPVALTRTGAIMGTPAYMSLEQLTGQ